MRSDESGKSITLPGLSGLLRRFGAPVAIVELPSVGASHRFGPQEIDGQLWSVDAESVQGFQAHAVARTIHRLGVSTEDTDPDSLLAATLTQFLTNQEYAALPDASGVSTDDAVRAMEFGDTVRTEVDNAERTTVELRVAGELREVLAVHCRDHTGVGTPGGGDTRVAVLPPPPPPGANLGTITG